jgi:hypothetical protein
MHKNIIVRFLLVGFLFLPTLAQHAHIFAHHDHPVCDESNVHFHAIDTTCELSDYVLELNSLPFLMLLTLAPLLFRSSLTHLQKSF